MTLNVTKEHNRVYGKIRQQEKRVLVRVGSYAAATESRMFKRSRRSAMPGQPPNAHAPGKSGIKDVRYVVNFTALNAIVGHANYNRRSKVRSRKPFPRLMDEGGSAVIASNDPVRGQKQSAARYRPHPFKDKSLHVAYVFMGQAIKEERL